MNENEKNKEKLRHLRVFWVAMVILLIIIGVWILIITNENLRHLLTSPEALREKILSFGNLAPLVIIIYHIFQVVLAPLPGQAVDMANGYIFGALRGSMNSLIGIFIGTAIAISLARRFGQPLIKRIVPPKRLTRINKRIGKRSIWFFFILFLIPGLPDDILCFALGLTRIPLWKGVLIAILGRTPTIVGSVILGSTGYQLSPWQFILFALGIGLLLLVLLRFIPRLKTFQKITE